ncbi:hypothetical protein FRC09_014148 [Ceratobasidium sp. 395]|nr:hypothetical protein FRC09_014148 [Ceratobasidium sp. 395]
MPNDSQDVVGRPTSRGLMARSLVRLSRGAANVPLPGFAELGDMMKELVEDWKTADHKNNELVWLTTRLEDLCSVIIEFDMAEYPDVFDAWRKFNELKDSLAEGFKCRLSLGIHSAEQKQRLLDGLNHEIDRVVEMTLLRLALGQAQSSKHNPIENFQVIYAHEITDQIPVYSTVCLNGPIPASEKISWPLAPDRPVVTSSTRRARLGKASVMYKTFNSRSDSGLAAKVAEVELKHLSRCLHPNVAKIVGVTKGYDGLNGYVVAEDGIPLDQFLFRVNSGAALVKLIRGIDDLRANTMNKFMYYFNSDHITVKRDGQLTVFPVISSGEGGCFTVPYFSLSEDDRAALNPAIREFLAIYYRMKDCRELIDKFHDSVMTLGWKPLTELEMARLAAKHQMLPDSCARYWQGPNVPPYTANVGDIGYVLSQDQRATWSPIELSKCAPGIQGVYGCWCNRAQDRWAYTESDGWIR